MGCDNNCECSEEPKKLSKEGLQRQNDELKEIVVNNRKEIDMLYADLDKAKAYQKAGYFAMAAFLIFGFIIGLALG